MIVLLNLSLAAGILDQSDCSCQAPNFLFDLILFTEAEEEEAEDFAAYRLLLLLLELVYYSVPGT